MSNKTIYDLARELKVAPSTISKALNGLPGVCQEKRKMINDYAQQNGYYPTPSARTLKSKSSHTIGILYSEELNIGLEHPFFSPVLQKAKEYLESNGYDLTFITAKLGNVPSSYANFCSLRHIAGVFIVSGNTDDKQLVELIEHDEFKYVATDYINNTLPTVLSNNKQGIKEMVEYFKDKGVKSMGIIMGPKSLFTFNERLNHFLEETSLNEISVSDEHIIYADDYDYNNGYNSMIKMIKQSAKLPEVIFAVSDLYALGAIRALEDNNYKIPVDVSVVGFDDIELARYSKPSISTIRQNTKEIGVTAAKVLLKQVKLGTTIRDNLIRIPTQFIKRDSSI